MRLPLALIALAAILTMTAVSQEQVTSMDRAKRIMAIRAAAKRVIEDSKAFLDNPRTRALMRAMMENSMKADVAAHKQKDVSRNLCLTRARLSIQDLLASNVVLAVADAAQHSPLPITVADVLVNVDSNWTGSANKVADGFAERHFEGVFTAARQSVTANQRSEAEKKISYPPYPALNKELDRLAGGRIALPRAEFDAIVKWWSGKTARNLPPLFDEVQTALNATFKQIGGEIADQSEHQLVLVQHSVSNRNDLGRYLTAGGIYDRIDFVCRGEMRKTARETPQSGAAPVYDLFDITAAAMRTNADRLETECFSDYIRSLVDVPVSTRDLGRAILSNPAEHKNARRSSKLLNAKMKKELSGWAASEYVLRADCDSSVRNATTVKYFASKLTQTGAAASAWSACVKRALKTPLTEARADAARQQAEKYFSRFNKVKILADDAVNTLADKRNFAKFKTMAELRESMPELIPAEKDTGVLLDETEKMLIGKANSLNTSAEQAVRGQERCLRELEKDRLPRLEQEVAARKPAVEIISAWSVELAKKWANQRKAAGSPYSSILKRTDNLLNKTVRQLYDTKLSAVEKKSSPQDSSGRAQFKQEELSKKPRPASGGGAADEGKTSRRTKGDTTADLFFVIRDVAKGKCEVLLEAEDGTVLSKAVFNPERVEVAAENVFLATRDNIRQTVASRLTVRRGALFGLLPARRSGLKELNIYIVVQSARVRLKTSLLIREKVENLIDQWAQESSFPAPKIRWGTGLSNAGENKLKK